MNDTVTEYEAEYETDLRAPQIPLTEAGLEKALNNFGIEVRFNKRSGQRQWRSSPDGTFGHTFTIPDTWSSPQKHQMALAIARIAETFNRFDPELRKIVPARFTLRTFDQFLLANAAANPVEPVRDFFRLNLPEWDGTERIAGLLSRLFTLDTAQPGCDLICDLAERICTIGIIQRTFEPGCEMDMVPVLFGPSGVGKSTFARELIPRDLQEDYFTDNFDLTNKDPRHRIEELNGKIIAEIAELAGMRKAEVEHVKANITRRIDRGRVAYGTESAGFPRTSIFIGTANPNDYGSIPNDPALHQRIVPVPILSRGENDPETYLSENTDQIMAEALHCYDQGDRITGRSSQLGKNVAQYLQQQTITDPALVEAVRYFFEEDFVEDGHTLANLQRDISLKLPQGKFNSKIALDEIRKYYRPKTVRIDGKARWRWVKTQS